MIKTLIIGGGAAGLYAASLLPEAVVLERNEETGRKLLLTGGGRCNYTHSSSVPDLLPHYHGSLPFIRKVLYCHPPESIINHFRQLGIEPTEENGKIFPRKGDAESILKALMKNSNRIIRGKAERIEKHDGVFRVLTEKEEIEAEHILLTTGGMAYPHTGSDGNGYALASALGHSITPPRPALAALDLTPSLKSAEGITLDVELTRKKKTVTGSAVITSRGISGPAPENFSYLLNGREEITISFMQPPDMKRLRMEEGRTLVKNAFPLPPRLVSALLPETAEKRLANLSKEEERLIVQRLSSALFTARPIAGSAMTTAGGVKTDEINPETMESRFVPGLYFAGDIIDIDADCGGYSLTWAFATAFIAASAVRI